MKEYERLYSQIIFKQDFNYSNVKKKQYKDYRTINLKSEINSSVKISEIIKNFKSNIFSIKLMFSRCSLLEELKKL